MERVPSKRKLCARHALWKIYRVIPGHLGAVLSIAVDPNNSWFCTGSADRTIKIWDLTSGRLKHTLTGHTDYVQGLAVSSKHTKLFSVGDDEQVKCWDLELNKAIRSYDDHGGVWCLALPPTIDNIFLTGGRDFVCRVWDIRIKEMQVQKLTGHEDAVHSILTPATDPQVVTGSEDSTIKYWDLRYGKSMLTLTHHESSVHAMALHPKEESFASVSDDNMKKFSLPRGEFMHDMPCPKKTIFSMAVNEEGVLTGAGIDGSLSFWDWRSGHNFQHAPTGSLPSEACIYDLAYDSTGSRLITCEADKTIKMWKEDETVTPETHHPSFQAS